MSVDQTALLYDQGSPQASAQVIEMKGAFGLRMVSALNTAAVVVIDLFNLHDTLAIDMVCSAGTASLTIEVSVDNTNWRTVDSLAAAAATAKQYIFSTNGATLVVSPLAYRYIRITAGAAGVGNTTTTNIAAK